VRNAAAKHRLIRNIMQGKPLVSLVSAAMPKNVAIMIILLRAVNGSGVVIFLFLNSEALRFQASQA